MWFPSDPQNDKLKPRVNMAYLASPYLEERNGGLYVEGTRVSLDSLVIRFQEGASPERIVQSFPTLKLSLVCGAIAYYLENQQMVNEYIRKAQRELERTVPPLSQSNPELFARLQAARGSGAPRTRCSAGSRLDHQRPEHDDAALSRSP
jgi:uncharacterized protein (DUF433 family)